MKEKLSSWTKKVLYDNATETPHDNKYWNHWVKGIYVHIISGQPLFSSYDKFSSSCGWPTFYRPINEAAIKYQPDYRHGMVRTEIRDQVTDTHLGHVFDDLQPVNLQQGFRRYCLNSAALKFISEEEIFASDNQDWKEYWTKASKTQVDVGLLTIAGGCFWGVQQLIRDFNGVYKTQVGYANYDPTLPHPPTYQQVCTGKTKAVEVVQVFFNKKILPISKLLTLVFKRVDPTTLNYQGNDVGTQYRSGIYYSNKDDYEHIVNFVKRLKTRHQKPIVVEVLPLTNFALAEDDHQDYLIKNPFGYCHIK